MTDWQLDGEASHSTSIHRTVGVLGTPARDIHIHADTVRLSHHNIQIETDGARFSVEVAAPEPQWGNKQWLEYAKRSSWPKTGIRFSFSQRERAGVRGKATWLRTEAH